ncbi:sensor protein [Bifidobacterium aquikefiri]|uniref:histidine kinase n=2 Tax=Bifidobacterium aquikefiri TaxID=1653207 RepID=A0A261G1Z9_9BIFI|nr:sensor protein [Bifidobacterium aquikefiri]
MGTRNDVSETKRSFQARIKHRFSRCSRAFAHNVDSIPLSTKLVASMIVVLILGTFGITVAIRQMVGGYLLKKTDTQLNRQASLVFSNIRQLSQEDSDKSALGPTDYFLQIRDDGSNIMTTPLTPSLPSGIVSTPNLPASGTMGNVQISVPFTTSAHVSYTNVPGDPDSTTVGIAKAPWRVLALKWEVQGAEGQSDTHGVLFIGLSLSDQIDTMRTLTKYCIVFGASMVLMGAALALFIVNSTLTPLKRIEKTAAKIAQGDLSQRIPAVPETTEVGSLSASLNSMLARIEQSFHEQTETTNKMKRFVSDASHELRTPLAAIHGYAELYKMQRDYPGALERADKSIEHIEASSTRMAILVEDLLSLARLDEGRGIELNHEINLTTLVNDTSEDLHALDPARTIQRGIIDLGRTNPTVSMSDQPNIDDLGSRKKAKSGTPKVSGQLLNATKPMNFQFSEAAIPEVHLQGDPSRIRQVVTNIVGNIHRYTPSDSPVQIAMNVLPATIDPQQLSTLPSNYASFAKFIEAVEVGEATHIGNYYAVMQYIDHGPGVPPESHQKLFERFYTADPSRAREKGGTGLGLAIAQSIVKAHKGLICATESDGGGLTFTIVLPLAEIATYQKSTVQGQKSNIQHGSAAKGKAQSDVHSESAAIDGVLKKDNTHADSQQPSARD